MKNRILWALLLLACALPATTLHAEPLDDAPMTASRWRDYRRKSYMGLRFGLNVPSIFYKGTGGLARTTPLPRFHIGIVNGRKLGDELPFFFETGLYYTEKGAKTADTEETGERRTVLRYLQIPVVLKYKIETNADDFTLQPLFGGFIGAGIGGQTKDYGTRTKTLPFGSDRFRRFDAGLRIGCGAAYQNFYFEAAYDIGLFDIAGKNYTDYHYDNFDGHIRTGCFTLSLGVDF